MSPGCTDVQINDQGREFVNRVSTTLHELTGVNQRITSAYHPQANGLTERSNRTIQTGMLRILSEHQDRWDKVLPGVLFAYRTSVQKSTQYTPFYLMYGRHAKLPVDCELECIVDDVEREAEIAVPITDESAEDDIQSRLTSINYVRTAISKDATDNIVKAQERQKRDYAKRHGKKQAFAEGDDVLLWNLRRADRKGGRMKDPWLGPYQVTRVCEKGTYELANGNGETLRQKAHGVNLKRFVKATCAGDLSSGIAISSDTGDIDDAVAVGASHLPSDSCMDCPSLTSVTDSSVETPNTFTFQPTTVAWRKRACEQLSLPTPKPIPARQKKAILGVPCRINSMAKDGNCFFRTVSFEVCGNAECHRQIRDAVVKYMSDDDNKVFSRYIGNQVQTYINESSMNNDGIWATDVEIVATATLLQTAIFVYSDVSGDSRWLLYKPLVSTSKYARNQNMYMYITNLHQHFERVVAVE
jgi:hypothetical protein